MSAQHGQTLQSLGSLQRSLLNVLVRNMQIIARGQTLTKTAGTGPQVLQSFRKWWQEMNEIQNGLQVFMNFGSFWIISYAFPDSFRFTIFLRSKSPTFGKKRKDCESIDKVSTKTRLWNGLAGRVVTIHDLSFFKVPLWRHWFDHPRRLGISWNIFQHFEALIAFCFAGKVKIIDRKNNLVATSAKRVFESLKKWKSRHFAAAVATTFNEFACHYMLNFGSSVASLNSWGEVEGWRIPWGLINP